MIQPNENTAWIDQIDSQRLLSLDVTMKNKLAGCKLFPGQKQRKLSKKSSKKVVRLKRPDGTEAFLPYWRRDNIVEVGGSRYKVVSSSQKSLPVAPAQQQ